MAAVAAEEGVAALVAAGAFAGAGAAVWVGAVDACRDA